MAFKFKNDEQGEEYIQKIQDIYLRETDKKMGNEAFSPNVSLSDSVVGSIMGFRQAQSQGSRNTPFIYELLQNADDAEAENVYILINNNDNNSELYFIHDGKPFNNKELDAICSVGKSTKHEESDKIGKFGIGFKSVFLISKHVEIFSKNLNFKFDKNDKIWGEKLKDYKIRDIPWEIIPIWSESEITKRSVVNKYISKEIEKGELNECIKDLSDMTIFCLCDINKKEIKICKSSLSGNNNKWKLKQDALLFLNKINKIELLEFDENEEKLNRIRELNKCIDEIMPDIIKKLGKIQKYDIKRNIVSIFDKKENRKKREKDWLVLTSGVDILENKKELVRKIQTLFCFDSEFEDLLNYLSNSNIEEKKEDFKSECSPRLKPWGIHSCFQANSFRDV